MLWFSFFFVFIVSYVYVWMSFFLFVLFCLLVQLYSWWQTLIFLLVKMGIKMNSCNYFREFCKERRKRGKHCCFFLLLLVCIIFRRLYNKWEMWLSSAASLFCLNRLLVSQSTVFARLTGITLAWVRTDCFPSSRTRVTLGHRSHWGCPCEALHWPSCEFYNTALHVRMCECNSLLN